MIFSKRLYDVPIDPADPDLDPLKKPDPDKPTIPDPTDPE